jgi:hypothetical protein
MRTVQSIKEVKDIVLFNHPDLTDIAPELKMALGECILYWAYVESALQMLFSSLVSSSGDFHKANAIWESVVNFQAKLKAVDGLMALSDNKDYKAIWPKLEPKIRKMAAKRAEMAHSALCEKDQKHFLIPHFAIHKADSGTRYRVKDLKEAGENFRQAKFAVEYLYLMRAQQLKMFEVSQITIPKLILQIAQDNNHDFVGILPPPQS